jgi:Poxvirus D5 protein-like
VKQMDLEKFFNRLREISAAAPNLATAKYKDSVGSWIVACCDQDKSLRTSLKDLYASYRAWCEASRSHPLAVTSFGRELGRLGFVSVRTCATRSRWGIGLKPDFVPLDPAPAPEQPVFYGTTAEMLAIIKSL